MKNLKQILAVLMAFALMFGLVACKAGDKVPEENLEKIEATTLPVEEEAATDAAEPEETPAPTKALEEEETPDVTEAEEVEETPEASEAEETEEETPEVTEAEPEEETPEVTEAEEVEEEAPEATEVEEAEDSEEEASEPTEVTNDDQEVEAPVMEDSVEYYLFDEGFRVFDITGIDQVAVKNAVVAANFDPEALLQAYAYLEQSGILEQLEDDLDTTNLDTMETSSMEALEKLPIMKAMMYLDRFNINLYTVAFFDFEDAETAERAFYTGEGIIELTEEEKEQLLAGMEELQNELVNLAEEDPEGAAEVYDFFDVLLSEAAVDEPQWLKEDTGELLRTWSIELPVGTFFVEEAQKDNRVYLILSLVSTDGDQRLRTLNEGLELFDISPILIGSNK